MCFDIQKLIALRDGKLDSMLSNRPTRFDRSGAKKAILWGPTAKFGSYLYFRVTRAAASNVFLCIFVKLFWFPQITSHSLLMILDIAEKRFSFIFNVLILRVLFSIYHEQSWCMDKPFIRRYFWNVHDILHAAGTKNSSMVRRLNLTEISTEISCIGYPRFQSHCSLTEIFHECSQSLPLFWKQYSIYLPNFSLN